MEDGATCQCSVDEQHLAGNSRDIFVFLFCVKFKDSKQFMADCHGEQTSDWDRERERDRVQCVHCRMHLGGYTS